MLTLVLASLLAQGVSDDDILIGMEGEAQSFSVDEENLGMRLVMRHVNAAGGVHGRRLVEIAYPRDPSRAVESQVANARRLIEKDDVFLLFNFGGPGSVDIADMANAHGVPHLFPHTALITGVATRAVFTSFPRYDDETRIMLRYVADTLGAARIGVIHASNDYGRYFVDRTREFASQLGYAFVGAHALDRQAGDAIAQVAALAETNADTVVMAVYPAGARRIVAARAELDVDVQLVSTGPLTDEQYFDVDGLANGTVGFCHYPDPNESSEPGIVAYRELMDEFYPGHPLNRYSLYGYVFGSLIVEGLRRAGPNLERDTFLAAMESIKSWNSGGILPPVSFSPVDHHAQDAGFVCQLRNGRFEPLSGWLGGAR
ncbi:MAG: ABC transporter substrate-binding protein [Pseudomonadota bacterium]